MGRYQVARLPAMLLAALSARSVVAPASGFLVSSSLLPAFVSPLRLSQPASSSLSLPDLAIDVAHQAWRPVAGGKKAAAAIDRSWPRVAAGHGVESPSWCPVCR